MLRREALGGPLRWRERSGAEAMSESTKAIALKLMLNRTASCSLRGTMVFLKVYNRRWRTMAGTIDACDGYPSPTQ